MRSCWSLQKSRIMGGLMYINWSNQRSENWIYLCNRKPNEWINNNLNVIANFCIHCMYWTFKYLTKYSNWSRKIKLISVDFLTSNSIYCVTFTGTNNIVIILSGKQFSWSNLHFQNLKKKIIQKSRRRFCECDRFPYYKLISALLFLPFVSFQTQMQLNLN